MGYDIALYGKNKTKFVGTINECPKCGCKDIRKSTLLDGFSFIPSNKKHNKLLRSLEKERNAISCYKCGWVEYTVDAKKEITKEIKECPEILIPRKGSMCLYLPFDTCSHSTSICELVCLAKKEKHPNNQFRKRVKDILLTYPIDVVCNKIAKQVIEDKTILHWFASGDDPEDTDIILSTVLHKIMHFVMERDIPQNGFTRSPVFLHHTTCALVDASQYKSNPNNLRVAFTAEWEGEPDYWKISDQYKLGYLTSPTLLAVPDYKHNTTNIYFYKGTGKRYWQEGGCGSGGSWCYPSKYYQITKERMPQDCRKCYENGKGCFTTK